MAPQVRGYFTAKEKPLPIPLRPPGPEAIKMGNTPRESQPLGTARPPSGFQPIGGPLIPPAPSPGRRGLRPGPQTPALLIPVGGSPGPRELPATAEAATPASAPHGVRRGWGHRAPERPSSHTRAPARPPGPRSPARSRWPAGARDPPAQLAPGAHSEAAGGGGGPRSLLQRGREEEGREENGAERPGLSRGRPVRGPGRRGEPAVARAGDRPAP